MRTSTMVMAFALLLAACGNRGGGGGGGGTRDSGPAADAGPAMDSGPARDSGPGPVDAGPGDVDAGLEFDSEGCLTFMGASRLCGFSSDDTICAFSVECGTSSDMSQCGINCEMGTTVMCYTVDHVRCLVDAVDARSCSMLMGCGWIL